MHTGMQQACLQSACLRHWSANPIFEKKQPKTRKKKKRKEKSILYQISCSDTLSEMILENRAHPQSTCFVHVHGKHLSQHVVFVFFHLFFFLKIISLFSCTQELRFQRTINTKQACLMHSMHCARTCTPGCRLRTPREGPLTSSACR